MSRDLVLAALLAVAPLLGCKGAAPAQPGPAPAKKPTHTAGIGAILEVREGKLTVVRTLDGPASRAGIIAGDLIVAIDGRTTEGMPLETAVERLRGVPGSRVKVTTARNGATRLVVLTRVVLKVPPPEEVTAAPESSPSTEARPPEPNAPPPTEPNAPPPSRDGG